MFLYCFHFWLHPKMLEKSILSIHFGADGRSASRYNIIQFTSISIQFNFFPFLTYIQDTLPLPEPFRICSMFTFHFMFASKMMPMYRRCTISSSMSSCPINHFFISHFVLSWISHSLYEREWVILLRRYFKWMLLKGKRERGSKWSREKKICEIRLKKQ